MARAVPRPASPSPRIRLPSVKWLTAKAGSVRSPPGHGGHDDGACSRAWRSRMLARLMRARSWERRGGEKGRKLASGLSLVAVVTVSKVVSVLPGE